MTDKEVANRNPSPSFAKKGEEYKIIAYDDIHTKGALDKVLQLEQEETEFEELDPRVQEELEKLNHCTDKINEFELQLEEANAVFRTLLTGKWRSVKFRNCSVPIF